MGLFLTGSWPASGRKSSPFNGVLIMFRKLLSVAVLTAMFSFALGNTDAEARYWRNVYRSNGYGRSANYGYGNQGYRYGNQGYRYGNQGYRYGNQGYGGYGNSGYGGYGRSGYFNGGNRGYGYGNRGYGGVSYGFGGY